MSGIDNGLLVDTNLLIFLLDGNELAIEMLQDKLLYYSFITEIELLGVPGLSLSQKRIIESVLLDMSKITYNEEIAKSAIIIKQKKKIKVPDAIIAASAIEYKLPLLTADKGFTTVSGLECILFQL